MLARCVQPWSRKGAISLLAVVLALLCSACGGGGSGGAAAPSAPPATPASPTLVPTPAFVIRAEQGVTLADATLCVDTDGDGLCSDVELVYASVSASSSGSYAIGWVGKASDQLLVVLTVPGPAALAGVNLLACADANANGACDAGEARTVNHQAGLYRLDVPLGQAGSAIVFAASPGYLAPPSPQLMAGQRHLTVNWPAMAGALDYEVWWQQTGTAAVQRSRAAIAPAASGTGVHTITGLSSSQRYRVWVKARLADGSYRVSAGQVASPVTTPVATPSQQPAFVPASMDLPVLRINTQLAQPIVSRDDYLTATWALYADGAALAATTTLGAGSMQIRGRGHSTWEQFDKKPYRLKLDNSLALLGMPANRHWVLLANAADKSLLRNETAFEIGRRMGMAYTPRTRFVEVFLNGSYAGQYQLVEHLRTGANRVNIATLAAGDNSAPQVTGGYLLELDRRSATPSLVTARCAMPLVLQAPEQPSTQQLAYITAWMDGAESALHAGNFADPVAGYAAYLDVDSFVDWYIANELTMNADAFLASTYFYKDRGGKLFIGPLWDYDIALGNFNGPPLEEPGSGTQGAAPFSQTCWYQRLLADPAFVQKVRNRWRSLKASQLDGLPGFVDAQAAALAQSQANNFGRWLVLDKLQWRNVVVTGSHAGEVEYLRYWLQRRIEWLDGVWGN